MPKPVCVPCHRFFRPKKNGTSIVETAPIAGNPAPGNTEPDKWAPYKLWDGDLWECQGCGAQIISGFGHVPMSERHHPDFAEKIKRSDAAIYVNDC